MDQSLSRRANCDDHATAESFWAPLKTACCNNTLPATRAEARSMIFDDIETFYNPVRRHSALGFLSPVAFENQFNNNSLFPVRVFGSTSITHLPGFCVTHVLGSHPEVVKRDIGLRREAFGDFHFRTAGTP